MRQVPPGRFAQSDLPAGRVAVLFTADWCGYCRRFARHFGAVANPWVVDLSDDDDPLWDTFGIRVVPTVILFEDQRPTTRWAGALDAEHARQIQAALSGDPASTGPGS